MTHPSVWNLLILNACLLNGLSESLAIGAYAGLYASRACALEVGLCDVFESLEGRDMKEPYL